MSADLVLVERRDAVAVVTLNRPEKRNALSLELRERLAAVLTDLARDEALACVVLTGAGSAFCAGMDTTQFGGDAGNRRRILETTVAAFGALAELPVPVVAAVNGPAVAGGFSLALGCDIRIAAESARFGFLERELDLPPSYSAARAALPAPLARELCLTGRVVHAAEAVQLGIAAEVVEQQALMPRALELAEGIAARPRAARVTKVRIKLERERLWAPLFEEEQERLREALGLE